MNYVIAAALVLAAILPMGTHGLWRYVMSSITLVVAVGVLFGWKTKRA